MRHGVVPTPFAPHKTRDGEVVLRRGSSCPQTGPAARRLTWTDARDVAGRLEHVQIFDTADAMAQCAGIAPESARFAPDYSPVRRDDAVPGPPDAVPAFRGARVASPPSPHFTNAKPKRHKRNRCRWTCANGRTSTAPRR